MATERAANGEIPVEALLAQLRRAAEQDGVEDVDAVVAEFATFVRAQAPRIAAQRAGRRSGMSWSGALLTAGALSVAAFGALASGLVTNPFLPSTPASADADASAAGDADQEPGAAAPVLAGPVGDAPAGQGSSGDGATTDGVTTDAVDEPAPATAFAETAPMSFTDPDALAVLAEQRSAGPTPPPSTTPTAPSTTAPDPVATDPAAAAAAATTPTTPTTPATAPATDDTTTTLAAPVLDASTGPEKLISGDQQQDQQQDQNDAFTDQGGAG